MPFIEEYIVKKIQPDFILHYQKQCLLPLGLEFNLCTKIIYMDCFRKVVTLGIMEDAIKLE